MRYKMNASQEDLITKVSPHMLIQGSQKLPEHDSFMLPVTEGRVLGSDKHL